MVVWKVSGAVKQGAVSALTLLFIFVADTECYLDALGAFVQLVDCSRLFFVEVEL